MFTGHHASPGSVTSVIPAAAILTGSPVLPAFTTTSHQRSHQHNHQQQQNHHPHPHPHPHHPHQQQVNQSNISEWSYFPDQLIKLHFPDYSALQFMSSASAFPSSPGMTTQQSIGMNGTAGTTAVVPVIVSSTAAAAAAASDMMLDSSITTNSCSSSSSTSSCNHSALTSSVNPSYQQQQTATSPMHNHTSSSCQQQQSGNMSSQGGQDVQSVKDTTYTKIFVGGLPYHTTDKSLRKFFETFGEIEEAVVITDRQTGKSRGYGFVTMADREAADRAVKDANPIIDGRKANVNLAYLGAKPRSNNNNNNHYTTIPYIRSGSYSAAAAAAATAAAAAAVQQQQQQHSLNQYGHQLAAAASNFVYHPHAAAAALHHHHAALLGSNPQYHSVSHLSQLSAGCSPSALLLPAGHPAAATHFYDYGSASPFQTAHQQQVSSHHQGHPHSQHQHQQAQQQQQHHGYLSQSYNPYNPAAGGAGGGGGAGSQAYIPTDGRMQ